MGNLTIDGVHRPAPHHQLHWFTTGELGPNWWEALYLHENEGLQCLGGGVCPLRSITR
ncbi:hypothetical protein [Streptomyces odontomachi]|uniref:hypothetical protein n=1 Tax=Streptomyces odontomachi TaxID=2944940 RepID=UPI00210D9B22|nr:hypothetical protein [Streptomyces sp. ODS25]